MKTILQSLSGKKSIIASVIMTIVAYLWAKGYLGADETTVLWTLVTIIFGTASYQTGQIYKTNSKKWQ